MKALDFDAVKAATPDDVGPFEFVEPWFRSHPSGSMGFGDLKLAVAESLGLKGRDGCFVVLEVFAAVHAMCGLGMAELFYRTTDRSGALLPGEYRLVGDVPDDPECHDVVLCVRWGNETPVL